MKKLLFILLLFISSTLLANVAKVVALKGDATITRDGKIIKVERTSLLKNKDVLITQNNSKVQLLFKDETIISIGKNSQINIDDYIFESKDNVKAEFSMVKGVFRTITGQIGKIAPKNFKLKTKGASIGIRGTQIVTHISEAQERIFCTEGQIEITKINTNEKIIVDSGEFVSFKTNLNEKLEKRKTKQKDIDSVNSNITIESNTVNDDITEEKQESVVTVANTQDINKSTAINTSAIKVVDKKTKTEEEIKADNKTNDLELKLKAEREKELAAQIAAQKAEEVRLAREKAKKEKELAAKAKLDKIAKEKIAKEKRDLANAAKEKALLDKSEEAQEAARKAEEEAQLATTEVEEADAEINKTEEAAKKAEEEVAETEKASKEAEEEVTKTEEAVNEANVELNKTEEEKESEEETNKEEEEAAKKAEEEAAKKAEEEAAKNETLSKTPEDFFKNNNSKASYSGNFNKKSFNDKKQYIEVDKQKSAIPSGTNISMDIDFGAKKDQIKNGKIGFNNYSDIYFKGDIKKDSKIKLKGEKGTSGKGDGSFFTEDGNVLKGDVDFKNKDVKIKGDYEASKYYIEEAGDDFTDLELDKITDKDFFKDNNSTASYIGDFNDKGFNTKDQYLEIDKNKIEIPKDTSISMDIDFGAKKDHISNGKVDFTNYEDLSFDGKVKDNKIEIEGLDKVKGKGKGDFYGNEANSIEGNVDFDNKDVKIKGDFSAKKQ